MILNSFGVFLSFGLLVCGSVIRDEEQEIEDNPENLIDISHFGYEAFGSPNEDVGEKLEQFKPGKQNPEEVGTYFQGDILMPRAKLGRNGVAATTARWNKGIIPYEIKGNFTTWERNQILRAFKEYHTKTCIRFVPKTSAHKDYLSIQNKNTGCWSSVGKIGGKQPLNLQPSYCITSFGTILHELCHAAGFEHEQSRSDRDSWVRINWDKIPDDMEYNFFKADDGNTVTFGVPYAYNSVMHYSAYAFSESGEDKTIIPLKKGADKMGQRDGFAPTDIQKLNAMYNCKM